MTVVAVTYSRINESSVLIIILGRLCYMFFWFEAGDFYREKIEKKVKLRDEFALALIIFFQFVFISIAGRRGITAGIWNGEFTNNVVLTIACAATGIAFYLRVSRIIEPLFGNSRLIKYISTHTFSIMMHHIFAIFLLNVMFCLFHIFTGVGNFDEELFRTDFWYRYCPYGIGTYRLLYVFIGFFLPLVGCRICEYVKEKRVEQ